MSATDMARADEELHDSRPPTGQVDRVDQVEPATMPAARPWTVRRLTILLAPALVFLGIRQLGLLVLAWMSAANNAVMTERLGSWDGEWFMAIAATGYDVVPAHLFDAKGDQLQGTALAFFPGYPVLIRWVADMGGWLGVDTLAAALTVTTVAGVFCAYALARLGRRIRGGSPKTGLILVALFAASPMAVVLSMAYSEALFCALSAWALVGVLERRWVLAGTCCAFAGLVRPTAAALILAVGLAALVAVIQRRDGWLPWLCGAIAPVGLVGYLAWVGARTGSWDGWFLVQQRGWDSGFDGGVATSKWVVGTLTDPGFPFELATVGLIAVALVLVVICVVRRVEWPLLVYGIGVLVMNLASNGLMPSKGRLMIPAFTLLIPVAVGLAKRRTATMVAVLAAMAVSSAWFGAHSITSWQFAI